MGKYGLYTGQYRTVYVAILSFVLTVRLHCYLTSCIVVLYNDSQFHRLGGLVGLDEPSLK